MAQSEVSLVSSDLTTDPCMSQHHYKTKTRLDRPIFFTKHNFYRTFDQGELPAAASPDDLSKSCLEGVFERFRHRRHRCGTSSSVECFRKSLVSFFPFINILREYNIQSDLLRDVMSGLTVGIMHIPQGMAYGLLAKLDPVYGLYTSFFPVLFYFFFGTSRHISLGTFAVVSLMIAKVIDQAECGDEMMSQPVDNETLSSVSNDSYDVTATNSPPDGRFSYDSLSEQKKCQIGVAMAVTFVVGLIQITLGVLKFGFVTVYLSDPLTRALTMAAAVHVATSQIRHMFAIDMGRFSGPLKLIYMYVTFFKNIMQTNWAAVVVCLIGMLVIYSVQRWVNPHVRKKLKMPFPIELLLIIAGSVISHYTRFEEHFNIRVVGRIPTGIPPPEFPPVSRLSTVFGDAIGIAIVSFTINISMAKLFTRKHVYRLDSNQELLAYGIANCAGSTLNSYVSTASLSRSLIQESAGGKTQVAGLISCALLLVVLLVIAPLFYSLPMCILAAIVLINLKGILMQVTDVPLLFKAGQYYDLTIWLVTAASVLLTEVDIGLYIGVGFSLLTVIFRTQRPRSALLGRIPQTEIYDDVNAYATACEIPGLKVFYYGSSIYFANAEHFIGKLYEKTGCNPEEIKQERKRRLAETERQRKKQQRLMKKLKDQQMNFSATEVERRSIAENCHDVVCPKPVHEDAVDSFETITGNDDVTSDVEVTPIQNIIIDCSSVIFIDSVGISVLQQVMLAYKEIGVRVSLACCKGDVYNDLRRAGVFKKTDGSFTVFLGVHDAVLAAVESDVVHLNQLKVDASGVQGSIFDDDLDCNTSNCVDSDMSSHQTCTDEN